MRRKINSDSGAGMTVFGIAILMLILLLGIFIVDVGKNIYIKNQYVLAAQRATQTAVKDQDIIGGLRLASANTVINEYKIQTGKAIDSGRGTLGGSVYRGRCSEIKGKSYPIMEIYYDGARATKGGTHKFTSRNFRNMNITRFDESNFRAHGYSVVGVKVTDVIGNHFLSMFGMPCSEVVISSSAIISSSFDDDDVVRPSR